MSELVEFLTARLDEDRAQAIELIQRQRHKLTVRDVSLGYVRAFDPKRIAEDVAAKRRVVEAYEADYNDERYGGCGDDCEWKALGYVLRLLALPYADHPNYRQEWKP